MTATALLEADFQKQVIDLAHTFRWRCAHFRTALSQSGRWLTPVQADGKGFPDLVLVRHERLIFAELKAKGRDLRPEQVVWISMLGRVAAESPNVLAVVWRPEDWPRVQETLR